MDYLFIVTSLLKIVCLLGFVLGLMNYAVYAERRVSAFMQDRLGPNRVGFAGLFQPFADAGKFLLKEQFTPGQVNNSTDASRATQRRIGYPGQPRAATRECSCSADIPHHRLIANETIRADELRNFGNI